MRDVLADPNYKADNNTPFAFEEGELVAKRTGDYKFRGIIVSRFRKRSGAPRYVVENNEGILLILNTDQLTLND